MSQVGSQASNDLADIEPNATPYPITWLMAMPYPARNVLRRWRGMVGMVIGVGIALGIAMTLFAVGKASIDLYTADYARSGTDLYVVTRGGTLIPIFPSDTPGTIKNAGRVLSQVRSIPEVRSALGTLMWSMERGRPESRGRDEVAELIAVVGVDGDPAAIPGVLDLQAGSWVRRSDEVVIGARLSREKNIGIGDSIRISGRDFSVVGIGKLRGFGFSMDSMAYMNLRALRDRAGIGDVVNVIAIDTDHRSVARQQVEQLGSFSAFTPDELVAKAEEVNASSVAFFGILSFLALLISAIFVSNVLGRSVAERRLEFATLRAIGISRRTILVTVASEAILIGLVAGVLGVLISLSLGALINGVMAKEFGLESLYSADAALFAQVFAIALGIGIGAGLLPARQATRVDPVDVLREA
jgi:putative ABC transport system permease protein